MRFLNLEALSALALIVGVILLYILRMPRRRTIFSSTVILEMIPEIAKSKRMRRKLRTFLSAVLQVVILAFIVVACARPYVSTRGLANREIIVLIDRSASMQTLDVENEEGAATRFDKAKEIALGLINDMDLGDRMLLMAFDVRAEVLANFAGSKIVLREAIESVTPTGSATNIRSAIKLIQEVTKALDHPEIYILSDGSFDTEVMSDLKTENTSLFYRSIGTQKENLGITRFRARKSLNSDQDFEVVVTIDNNTAEKKSFDFELYLNGKIKDVHPMEIEPNASKSEVFTSTIVIGGALEGRISIEDAFPADNVAYEVIPLPRRQKVLMISEDTQNFLVPVLRSNFAVTGYRLPPEKYRPEYDVDVMIFYNYVPDKLPDSHIIYINSTGSAVPVTLKEQIKNPSVRHWDSSHPLMNYASLSNLFLTSAKKLTAPDWMEPVAEGVTSPLIVAGEKGDQKIVYVGFDPRHSDLPFRMAFPMFLSNCVQWFREAEDRKVSYQVTPGDAYRIRVEDETTKSVTITKPDGKKVDLTLTGGDALFSGTRDAGIYTWTTPDGLKKAFAVNLTSKQESLIAPSAALEIGEETFALTDLEDQLFYNKKLWVYLGLLAIGLLASEAYLFHHRFLF